MLVGKVLKTFDKWINVESMLTCPDPSFVHWQPLKRLNFSWLYFKMHSMNNSTMIWIWENFLEMLHFEHVY